MTARLTRADFDRLPSIPGHVSADERAELYRMSDAINAELRNEREAHAHLCSRCESALTHCTTPHACEAAERVRPVPRWMQRVLADQEPSGSREIPNWLLAVLLALAIAAITLFAPGAQAAINCQGDQEAFWQLAEQGRWQEYRDDCGYVYDMPALPLPPIIDAPAAPIPEPASWLLFLTGLAVGWAMLKWRKT